MNRGNSIQQSTRCNCNGTSKQRRGVNGLGGLNGLYFGFWPTVISVAGGGVLAYALHDKIKKIVK